MTLPECPHLPDEHFQVSRILCLSHTYPCIVGIFIRIGGFFARLEVGLKDVVCDR